MSETLPKGWVPVKFTDILEIRGGSQPPKKDFIYEPKEGFVRLLQIRDFGDKPFPTYVPLTSKLKIVGKDELLLARYGGTSKDDSLGRICTGMEGAYNVALVKLLFLPEFTPPGFIKHLFGAHFFLEVISKNSRSCQTGFNKDDLKDVSFPLPPLNEQKRIVAKLDKIIPRIDLVKARLDRVPTIIKRFRQSVLTAAVTGKLTEKWREGHPDVKKLISNHEKINDNYDELPETWVKILFGDVINELRNGVSLKPNINPPGTKILRISANRSGSVNLKDYRFLFDGSKKYNQYILKDGDLLFTRYNGNVDLVGVCGQVRNVKTDFLYPDKLMRVRLIEDFCCKGYIEYLFQTREIREYIISKSKTSAGQNGLSGKDLKLTPIRLPPLEEQKEIIRQVDKLFALADKLESHYQKAKTHVDKLSQSVLAKAFRGELVPQDPNDEPAEKLLERIIAEKAKMEGGKKKAGGRKKETK